MSSLRTRFAASFAAAALVLVGINALSVLHFTDRQENRLIDQLVLDEMDALIDHYQRYEVSGMPIERGEYTAEQSPLKNAPHTQGDVIGAEWNRPYSQQKAVFPLPYVADNKFWPTVNRIDDVYGDRNLFCSCVPMEDC